MRARLRACFRLVRGALAGVGAPRVAAGAFRGLQPRYRPRLHREAGDRRLPRGDRPRYPLLRVGTQARRSFAARGRRRQGAPRARVEAAIPRYRAHRRDGVALVRQGRWARPARSSGHPWLTTMATQYTYSTAGYINPAVERGLSALIVALVRESQPGGRVCDLGCGNGQLAHQIAAHGY